MTRERCPSCPGFSPGVTPPLKLFSQQACTMILKSRCLGQPHLNCSRPASISQTRAFACSLSFAHEGFVPTLSPTE